MCGVVAVRANGSTGSVWRGASVRTVYVVHGFPLIWGLLVVRWLASPLAHTYIDPSLCGQCRSGNPICERASGSAISSV